MWKWVQKLEAKSVISVPWSLDQVDFGKIVEKIDGALPDGRAPGHETIIQGFCRVESTEWMIYDISFILLWAYILVKKDVQICHVMKRNVLAGDRCLVRLLHYIIDIDISHFMIASSFMLHLGWRPSRTDENWCKFFAAVNQESTENFHDRLVNSKNGWIPTVPWF